MWATLTNFCAFTLGEVYLRRKLYGYPPAFERKIDKIREKKKAKSTRPEKGKIKVKYRPSIKNWTFENQIVLNNRLQWGSN